MGRRALVLAGGGSRGSYQIGVWRALRELQWNFDIVTGTSVGALNGALVVQNDFDKAVAMWEGTSTADVLKLDIAEGKRQESLREVQTKLGHFLSDMAKNGGADPRPLEKIVRECVDEKRIRNSAVEFAVVTVEYPSLTPCIMKKEDMKDGELVDYLMASAACFPAMQMRDIGGEKYIDGGYYDNMPVNLAAEYGADEIVAVDLEAVGRRKKVRTKGVQLHHISCMWDLGMFLYFDPENAKRNMRLGYLDAKKAFAKLEGSAYAFSLGEQNKNANALGPAFLRLEEKLGLSVQKYSMRQLGGDHSLCRVVHLKKGTHNLSAAALMAAAETAARELSLSPLEVYTFSQMNEALLGAAFAAQQQTLPEAAKELGSLGTGIELLEALKKIDNNFRLGICIGELRRAYAAPEAPSLLVPVLSRLFTSECAAALYLLALEIRQKEEKKNRIA